MPLAINTARRDTYALVTLTGTVDGRTAPEAQAAVEPLLGAFTVLVLDLTGVTYMSSAGLRVLLLIHRHLAARNGKAVLVGLSPQLADTMQVTGFLQFFETHAQLADVKL
jgi:anti-sigma B factor antagonist